MVRFRYLAIVIVMFRILAVCNYEIHLAAVTLLRDPFTQSSVPPRPLYPQHARLPIFLEAQQAPLLP
jgi:hypothetical protein